MLKVLFFARVREELDCSVLELKWRDAIATLDALQAQLVLDGGQRWQDVLDPAQHDPRGQPGGGQC